MSELVIWSDAGSIFDNSGDGVGIEAINGERMANALAERHGGIAARRPATVETTACTDPDTFEVLLYEDGSVAVYRTNHIGGGCD